STDTSQASVPSGKTGAPASSQTGDAIQATVIEDGINIQWFSFPQQLASPFEKCPPRPSAKRRGGTTQRADTEAQDILSSSSTAAVLSEATSRESFGASIFPADSCSSDSDMPFNADGNAEAKGGSPSSGSSASNSHSKLSTRKVSNGGGGKASRGKKSAYKHVPHALKPVHLVAKRNARERRRVQAVNSAFIRLRKHVPYEPRHKRLSKVKTLRVAITYISHLQDLIRDHDRRSSHLHHSGHAPLHLHGRHGSLPGPGVEPMHSSWVDGLHYTNQPDDGSSVTACQPDSPLYFASPPCQPPPFDGNQAAYVPYNAYSLQNPYQLLR
ncbi:hypothetical protein BaRGS_00007572, partial [Batillaria attramentaria]